MIILRGSKLLNRNRKVNKVAAAESLVIIMAIRVLEFSNGGYKIRKIFA